MAKIAGEMVPVEIGYMILKNKWDEDGLRELWVVDDHLLQEYYGL